MKVIFIALFLFCFSTGIYAVEKIEVQVLFSNKAVILVDGKRHIVAVGKVSPEGVKVISADSSGAVLEVDGDRKQYNLGDTNTDMKTANVAGMYAVGVTWGFRSAEELKANGAKTLINHPSELLKLVD